MSRMLFLTVLHLLPLIAAESLAMGADLALSRIGFGSCAKQDQPQPIWDSIVEWKPELFILLGDNIYGDSRDMSVLQAKYDLLRNQPGFAKLKQICPVIGTWDDHDYGENDAGAEFPKKKESQQLFLDFFDVPQNDPRRTQEGVYSSRIEGPTGKRVQIILLDTRYFRSPLKKGFPSGEPGEGIRGTYSPETNLDATVLGETQWRWLEEQLKVPAELRIIGSSIQLVANEHGFESWGNFPHERTRFQKVLGKTQARGVLVLSGDRHLAEISRVLPTTENGLRYPLLDITSSSLNAPSGNFTKAGTRFRNEINSHRVGLQYFDTNSGAILIDWNQPDPVIRLQIKDSKGDVVMQHRLTMSQLQ